MMPDPGDVLRAFDEAVNRGDAAAALALFSADAVVRYLPAPPPPAPPLYRGRAEIRKLLDTLIAEHARIEANTYAVDGACVVSPDRRLYADRHERLGVNPIVLTCNAVIEDGHIGALTMAFTAESLQRMAERKA